MDQACRRARRSSHPSDLVELLCCDEALLELLPEGDTQIVESEGDRRTTETRYTALGIEGVATFRFTFLMDGNVRFEKVCDGRVWRELRGRVSFKAKGAGTRVRVSLDGRTKPLVPEFTIKGPMEEQITEMSAALRAVLEA